MCKPSLPAGVSEKKHFRGLSAGGFSLYCAATLTKMSLSGVRWLVPSGAPEVLLLW